jgi:hypothetical protein
VDRRLAHLEHVRDLARPESEHVAQHEHCPLARREVLQPVTNASATASLGLIARVGPGRAVGDILEHHVGVGLEPQRLGHARVNR